MAAQPPDLVAELVSQLGGCAAVTVQRFFGGWQLRHAGQQFAIVMKGTLYFKVNDNLRGEMQRLGCRPFSYATAGGPILVPKYMSAPEDCLDDADVLLDWVQRVTATLIHP